MFDKIINQVYCVRENKKSLNLISHHKKKHLVITITCSVTSGIGNI